MIPPPPLSIKKLRNFELCHVASREERVYDLRDYFSRHFLYRPIEGR